ncbi:MAG: hypothetical protein WCF03_08160 [Nitrososphaeraceae archaeon]|jgi:hypothetical protein
MDASLMLTEISESLTYDGITTITLLAFGTLFSTVWTETNLSDAQELQPDTKAALITQYTRSNLSLQNNTCKEDDNFTC